MEAYLLRDEAPLSEGEWEKLDGLVVRVAQKILVGRRFLPLYGPVGAGVQTIALDSFGGTAACVHFLGGDPCGHEECPSGCDPIALSDRTYLPLPLLHKDFRLLWRDIATARQMNTPLEMAPAAAAAAAVAHLEDELIFRGNPAHGLPGLLTVEGTRVPLEEWGEPGAAFGNVAAARGALVEGGFYGPYALVLSPDLYGMTQRLHGNSGRLEIQQIETIAAAGVFQTPVLDQSTALLLSVGPEHMDLVVAQDLITAYLGPDGMDHHFRVLESLVLRVKRPGAICALEA